MQGSRAVDVDLWDSQMTAVRKCAFEAESETPSVRVWQSVGELVLAVEGGLRVLHWIVSFSPFIPIKNGFWRWWSRSTHSRGFDPVQDSCHGQPRQPEYTYHRQGSNRLSLVHSDGGQL